MSSVSPKRLHDEQQPSTSGTNGDSGKKSKKKRSGKKKKASTPNTATAACEVLSRVTSRDETDSFVSSIQNSSSSASSKDVVQAQVPLPPRRCCSLPSFSQSQMSASANSVSGTAKQLEFLATADDTISASVRTTLEKSSSSTSVAALHFSVPSHFATSRLALAPAPAAMQHLPASVSFASLTSTASHLSVLTSTCAPTFFSPALAAAQHAYTSLASAPGLTSSAAGSAPSVLSSAPYQSPTQTAQPLEALTETSEPLPIAPITSAPSLNILMHQLASQQARRNVALAQNELQLREIIAPIEQAQLAAINTSTAQTSTASLLASFHALNPYVSVTDHSTASLLPYTVEELTTLQLRLVFNYISSTNIARSQIAQLVDLPEGADNAPMEERTLAARVVHILRQLSNISQNTLHSFRDLGALLAAQNASNIRYTVLMAWIHELQHTVTGISVQRDLLQELLPPRFLQSAGSQNHQRATLEIFHVTEDVLREALAFSSAVSAHATRLIRILEAYQLEHVAQQHQQDMTPLDEDYQRLFQTSMPLALPPTSPAPYIQSLQWWRCHYSETLRANATHEYLQLVERESPLLPTTITVRCTIASTTVSVSSSSTHAPTYTTPAFHTPVVSSIASTSCAQVYLPTNTDFHDSPSMVEARTEVLVPSSPLGQSQSLPSFGGETASNTSRQTTSAHKSAVASGRAFPLKSSALQRKAFLPTGSSSSISWEPQSAVSSAEGQPNSPSVAGSTPPALAPLTSVSGPPSLPYSTSKIPSLLAFSVPRPSSPFWREAGLASTSKISCFGLGASQDDRWPSKASRARGTSPRYPLTFVRGEQPHGIPAQGSSLPSAAPSFVGAASEPQRALEFPRTSPVPLPGAPPCVFCSSMSHWSADSIAIHSLTDRARVAINRNFCPNCLKSHFGQCIGRDNCGICHKPGHHPAFCVQNGRADVDIGMQEEEFYQELIRRTYQPPLPGRSVR
ncbi:hypothetical protein Aduo_001765 [Ancylostoma duodenale]